MVVQTSSGCDGGGKRRGAVTQLNVLLHEEERTPPAHRQIVSVFDCSPFFMLKVCSDQTETFSEEEGLLSSF